MIANPPQIDSTIKIVTPENIAFQYRVAGPFRRLPAYLIDFAIRLFFLIGLATLLSFLSLAIGGLSTAIWLIAYFVLEWFYGGIFETFMNGQTPGKRLCGIRVLSISGRPINGLQALMRNIMRTVDTGPIVSGQAFGLPPIPLFPTFMIGLVGMTVSRRYQRLGDLVCRTMVVIDERPWFAGMVELNDPRLFELATHLPTDIQISRSMARAVAHYAERRRYFSVPRRQEVAGHLARPLLARFGLPANTSYDLFLCAVYYRVFIADVSADEERAAHATTRQQLASAAGAPRKTTFR